MKAFLKRQLKGKPEKQPEPHDLIKIYLKVPYLGKQGEQLVTIYVNKVHENTKFISKHINTAYQLTVCSKDIQTITNNINGKERLYVILQNLLVKY